MSAICGMHPIIAVLFCGLSLLLPIGSAAYGRDIALRQTGGETLSYKVSYQGLLSLYLPVEIAEATLQFHPGVETIDGEQIRHASLAVSTESFPSMEAVYPLRLNYNSWFDSELRYSVVVEMRRQSSKSRHELLWFNRDQGVVRSYRKAGPVGAEPNQLPAFLRQVSRLQQSDSFKERRVLDLGSGHVLDRLAMLYALRNRPLVPGEEVKLMVSNGKDLLGYRIAVEAREQLVLDEQPVSALRLKFTPQYAIGGDKGYAVHVWLSDDERRLPIRFRSSKLGGSIELELNSRVY